MVLRGLLSLSLILASTSARAFGLGDHKRIMLQALSEIEACSPGTFSSWDELKLWFSDLEEDVNVIRKDLLFSHFYNPNKSLNMIRLDSSKRVGWLQLFLRDFGSAATRHDTLYLSMAGQAIHHIQDMGSPPHVVPVMHGLWDGFETFEVESDIGSGWSCEQLQNSSGDDLVKILSDTALETLTRLRSSQVRVLVRPQGQSGPSEQIYSGEAFWKASSNSDFGQYGSLGNNFGQDDFEVDEVHYRVPTEFYVNFKREQLRLAVRSTIKGLEWYLNITSRPWTSQVPLAGKSQTVPATPQGVASRAVPTASAKRAPLD